MCINYDRPHNKDISTNEQRNIDERVVFHVISDFYGLYFMLIGPMPMPYWSDLDQRINFIYLGLISPLHLPLSTSSSRFFPIARYEFSAIFMYIFHLVFFNLAIAFQVIGQGGEKPFHWAPKGENQNNYFNLNEILDEEKNIEQKLEKI